MRCAIVNKGTGRIENFVEADPFEDVVPDHQIILPAGSNVPGTYDYMLANDEWVLTPEAETARQRELEVEQEQLQALVGDVVEEAWA